jgi:hypothetical protein
MARRGMAFLEDVIDCYADHGHEVSGRTRGHEVTLVSKLRPPFRAL